MRLPLQTSESITAVLSGAPATTQPTYHAVWQDQSVEQSASGSLSGETAVEVLAAGASPRKVLTSLVVCNIDTAAVTVTLQRVNATGTGFSLAVVTLQVSDTLVLDSNGLHVVDANGQIKLSSAAATVDLADDTDIVLGTGDDALLRFSTADASNHSLVLALDDTSQSLHVTDKGAVATDWNVSAETHPTLFLHSNTTPATDYLKIGSHNGTSALLDVVGGTTLLLKAAGNEIIDLVQAANAVNGIKVLSNATGLPPAIGANGTGAEADIGLELLDSNGNEVIELVATASAVNELAFTNAATGNAPEISATGDDTNINLQLTPKGAGFVLANGPFQNRTSTSVTATVGGGTTGLIPAGASFVEVTSDNADKQISLPAASVGDRIRILVGATGCELISSVATHKVNDVVVGDTNEAALTATNLYDCEYVATDTWVVVGKTHLGAIQAALVPDAL